MQLRFHGETHTGPGLLEVLAQAKLPKDVLKLTAGDRAKHFRAANQMLYERMTRDNAFAKSISPELREFLEASAGPKGGMCDVAPGGWVWHHNVEEGLMQLMREEVHNSGKSWDILHPVIDGKHRGGFWLWGGA